MARDDDDQEQPAKVGRRKTRPSDDAQAAHEPPPNEPAPKDEALFLWLEGLFFHDDAWPEKIEVRAVNLRSTKEVLGALITQRLLRANSKMDKASIVALSNELLHLMQRDADVQRKSMVYGIYAIHFSRNNNYYDRFLVRCEPTGLYSREGFPRVDDADDDDSPTVRLLKELLTDERRKSTVQLDMLLGVLSGALERSDERLERVEALVDGAWQKQAAMMQATENLISQSHARDEKGAWGQLQRDLARAGAQKALDVLGGIAAARLAPAAGAQPGTLNPLAAFIASITKEEGEAAFGGEPDEAGHVPGAVFSDDQFQLMMKIAKSSVIDDDDVAALRESIVARPELIAKAQEIFGLGRLVALVQWFKEREAAAASANGAVQ